MSLLRKLGLLSIPLTFLLAGVGMFLLLDVDQTSGNYFQRLQLKSDSWNTAHLILLISTMFILPAALSIHSAISTKISGHIGTVMILLIAPTSLLLAGQYAIDFIMPLLSTVGGDALNVHKLMYQTDLITTLFYNLPNLVFLALMILSMALVGSDKLTKTHAIILGINWVLVLIGNLIDPLFQRLMIISLSVSFLPFVVNELKKDKPDQNFQVLLAVM